MQPLIRWAGSKRQLLPKLRAYWPKTAKRYIEPFCGSACLFFDIEPKEAVLGDLNTELIATYRALKADPSLVCECLRRLNKGANAYYRTRAVDPSGLSDSEMAARFIYLNRFCFNGIFRTNRLGKFNVPYGPPRSGAGFDFDKIHSAAHLLRRSTLIAGDFEKTLQHVERDDFVYIDPPYAVANRRIFSQYHEAPFGVPDLERLGSRLETIDKVGAHFVISYADSREARSLLANWKPRRVRTQRHIAGFAGDRRYAFEIIATNIKDSQHGN